MQYQGYNNKIKKIADILARLYVKRVLILSCMAAVLLVVIALVSLKGLVISTDGYADKFVYGDPISVKATAFLAEAQIEYCEKDSDAWSTEAPTDIGDYSLRAVSTSSFGSHRYSKVQDFSIVRRETVISVTDTEVVYGEEPSFFADNLLSNHSVSCDVSLEDALLDITNTSVDPESVKIIDENGRDVTFNYLISDTPISQIKVLPRELYIRVSSATKVYDNIALSCGGYELSNSTVAYEDFIVVRSLSTIIDAGTAANDVEFTIRTSDGRDATSKYKLHITPGILSVAQKSIFVSTGSITTVYSDTIVDCPVFEFANAEDEEFLKALGYTMTVESGSFTIDSAGIMNLLKFKFYDQNNVDKTNNFFVVHSEIGMITVNPRPVIAVTPDDSWVYDGEYRYPNGNIILKEKDGYPLLDHTVQSNIPEPDPDTPPIYPYVNGYSNAGVYENKLTAFIYRKGEDVSNNYVIEYVYGTITIDKRPISFETESAEIVYEGKPLYFDNVILHAADGYEPIENHIALPSSSPSFTNVGTYTNEHSIKICTNKGTDVTQNYDIRSYTYGRVTILPRPIKIVTDSATRYYDTDEHTFAGFFEVADEGYPLVNGHKCIAIGDHETFKNAFDAPVENRFSIEIKSGNDIVTHNYKINYEYGEVWIQRLPIYVKTKSAELVYDANKYTFRDFKVSTLNDYRDVLLKLTFAVIESPVFENAGEYENLLKIGVLNDIDSNFEYIYDDPGTILILPRPVTVRTESTELIYDGMAHSFGKYEVIYDEEYPKIPAHTPFSASVSEYIDAGSHDNMIEIGFKFGNKIVDINNYDVKYEYGKIDILPRQLRIITETASPFVYDGLPHSFSGFRVVENNSYPLLYGQMVELDQIKSYSNVGIYKNELTVKIVDTKDPSVTYTHNYEIEYVYGSVTIEKRPITVITQSTEKIYDGMPESFPYYTLQGRNGYEPLSQITNAINFDQYVDAGTYANKFEILFNSLGENVTNNYDIEYVYGSITIDKLELTVTPLYVQKRYDGTPLYPQNALMEDAALSSLLDLGFSYQVVNIIGEQTEPGEGTSYIENIRFFDPSGRDITSLNLIVHKNTGILRVYDNNVIGVFLYQLRKQYDGTPIVYTKDDYRVTNIPLGYSVELDINISLTNVGTLTLAEINIHSDKYASYKVYDRFGNDVTEDTVIIFETIGDNVVSEITPRKLTITSASETRFENGEPLTNDTVRISMGSLIEGHNLYAPVRGSVFEAGQSVENTIYDHYIFDQEGNNITDNYDVEYIHGILTLLKKNEYQKNIK